MAKTPARLDLLELTLPVLTAMANAGLVKRAQRDVGQGTVTVAAPTGDQTVIVTFDDGNTVTLPPGSGLKGSCTCGASGTCRHLLGAVLSYQATPTENAEGALGSESEADDVVSPVLASTPDGSRHGVPLPEIDDETLNELIGERGLRTAETRRRTGYVATVYRGAGDEPCRVELGTTTVRFLLGADLRYARCDCTARTACEHVALAVWAQRAVAPDDRREAIVVGIGGTSPASARQDGERGINAVGSDPGVTAVAILELVERILRDGIGSVASTIGLRVAAVRRTAEAEGQCWTVVLLDRLTELVALYGRRAAVDVAPETATVLAGLMARQRAAAAGSTAGGLPPALVLGTNERADTAIGQTRLTGAGAAVRTGDAEGSCEVEIVLVDPATSTALVARKTFAAAATDATLMATTFGSSPSSGPTPLLIGTDIGRRRMVPSVSVQALATGSVLTNAAVRRADRVVQFRVGGLRRTFAVAGAPSIDRFRDAGLVAVPSLIVARQAERPPRLLRPLLATEDLVAVKVAHMGGAFYDPAAQRVVAHAFSATEEEFAITATYRDVAPGAPGSLARFAGECETGFVVGRAYVRDGRVIVIPTLLAGPTGLVVPDLAPVDRAQSKALSGLPVGPSEAPSDAIDQSLQDAQAFVADLCLTGRSARASSTRGADVASALRRAGLVEVAATVERLHRGVASPGHRRIAQEWADAAISVSIGRELRS